VTGRIAAARQGAAAFLKSMEIESGVFTNSGYNKPVHTPGMTLPATYNALSCLRLIGKEPDDPQRLEAFLNSFQTDTGAYRIPEMKPEDLFYPDFEYDDFHITNYVLSALEGLGRPARPFAFLEGYNTTEKLDAWLDRRDMQRPWTEGNYMVNLASFFFFMGESGLIERLYQWHLENQDESGYWHDPSIGDLVSAMAGAAHNFHIFYKLNRPVPRYRKIIDHCLSIPNAPSTACIDIDIADILAHFIVYGYRTDEIKTYLAKKLSDLLDIQQSDGGFYDTTEGIRLFDGWKLYEEPQGLSNCFATWFRMAAIGFCAEVLYPGAFTWRFREGIGIGYYNREYLRGGFSEPEERPARQYARDDLPASAPCSEELRAAVRECGRRFASSRVDLCCVFHVEKDGAFMLDLRNGDVREGDAEDCNLRVFLSLKTLQNVLAGKLNPTAAYALRKIKLKGDISGALKLVGLLGGKS
jgi:hypothetical protein